MMEEVVQHGGQTVDHGRMDEDVADVAAVVAGHHFQHADRLAAHLVVESGQHADVLVTRLPLLPLTSFQISNIKMN